jgi:thiol-disulfide isomerase/thioredoxin
MRLTYFNTPTRFRQLFFILSFLLPALNTSAQSPNSPYFAAVKFQQYMRDEPAVDSAVYYARILSRDPASFYELFHISFFSYLQEPSDGEDRLAVRKKVLEKAVADSSQFLSASASPMYFIIQALECKNDPVKLSKLTDDYIKNEIKTEKLYLHKTGRYGLILYSIISNHPELKNTAQNLLSTLYNRLSSKSIPQNWTQDPEKRAWYKYMHAHVSYLMANQTTNTAKKGLLLKEASDYSPDFSDTIYESGYLYENNFVSGKSNYRQEYLNFVSQHSKDKNVILNALLTTALYSPEYKAELKDFYNSRFSGKTEFQEFWLKSVDSLALSSPPFNLDLLDGKPFNSQSKKWIMLDFWGTWCGPCRAEHPDLQNFYETAIQKNEATLSLLTIACSDQKVAVANYMKEKNFSFPVAMSDNQIEKVYKITRYPTKILLTPSGKYITIPTDIDWIKFIKDYCDIDS